MPASHEYTARIITTFAEAAEANRRTPGRMGTIVILTPEMAADVMITGDLHGHAKNFNLIRHVADLDANPRRHVIFQEACHGGPTYSSGACRSHTILEEIARLKTSYPDRVHFILGNHELAELTDYPIQKNRQMLNFLFRMGLQQMYGQAADWVRQAMLGFLQSCPLAVRLPHGVFVSHSIPEFTDSRRGFDPVVFRRDLDPGELNEQNSLFQLVWGRDLREENARAFAEIVEARLLITGHEPCPEQGYQVPNSRQIILDCCSDKACYVILPSDREFTQAEVIGRIRRLGA